MPSRLATLLLVGAIGCSNAPRPARMAPDGSIVPGGSRLRGAIAVGTVTGGERSSRLTYSRVGADEVRAALTLALGRRGMLAADPASAPFRLDVGILEVSPPPGPNVTTRVHAVLRYALRAPDGTTAFDRVVDAVGEATISEVFYGPERLRVANERSIRANLDGALNALATAEPTAGLASPPPPVAP